MISLIEGCR